MVLKELLASVVSPESVLSSQTGVRELFRIAHLTGFELLISMLGSLRLIGLALKNRVEYLLVSQNLFSLNCLQFDRTGRVCLFIGDRFTGCVPVFLSHWQPFEMTQDLLITR